MGETNGNIPYEVQPNAIPSAPVPTQKPGFADLVISADQAINFMKITDIGGKADGILTVDDYTTENAFTLAAQPKSDGTWRTPEEFNNELERQKLNPDVQQKGAEAFELGKKSGGLYGPRTSFSIEEAAAQNINNLKTAFPDDMKKLNINTDLSTAKPTEILAKMAEVLKAKQAEGMEK